MRRRTSEPYCHAEGTPSRCQAGRSWSESEPWGMRYGCQSHHRGAATSGLTTPTAPNRTPPRSQEALPQRRRASPPDCRAGRASGVSSSARGGGKEDAEQEQRAGCCAGHPLDFQHTLNILHHHACRFGGHSPAAQMHTHARTQTFVHRAQFSVRESGAPRHLPPLPCAQPARLWGLRGRFRRSRGSDDGGRRCAGTTGTPQWRRVDASGQDSGRKHARPAHTCGGNAKP
jgi:hypothetical protein